MLMNMEIIFERRNQWQTQHIDIHEVGEIKEGHSGRGHSQNSASVPNVVN